MLDGGFFVWVGGDCGQHGALKTRTRRFDSVPAHFLAVRFGKQAGFISQPQRFDSSLRDLTLKILAALPPRNWRACRRVQ